MLQPHKQANPSGLHCSWHAAVRHPTQDGRSWATGANDAIGTPIMKKLHSLPMRLETAIVHYTHVKHVSRVEGKKACFLGSRYK